MKKFIIVTFALLMSFGAKASVLLMSAYEIGGDIPEKRVKFLCWLVAFLGFTYYWVKTWGRYSKGLIQGRNIMQILAPWFFDKVDEMIASFIAVLILMIAMPFAYHAVKVWLNFGDTIGYDLFRIVASIIIGGSGTWLLDLVISRGKRAASKIGSGNNNE